MAERMTEEQVARLDEVLEEEDFDLDEWRRLSGQACAEIRRCWAEMEGLREALAYIASGDCADPAGWADLALKEEAKR